jgi:hypothetical protein
MVLNFITAEKIIVQIRRSGEPLVSSSQDHMEVEVEDEAEELPFNQNYLLVIDLDKIKDGFLEINGQKWKAYRRKTTGITFKNGCFVMSFTSGENDYPIGNGGLFKELSEGIFKTMAILYIIAKTDKKLEDSPLLPKDLVLDKEKTSEKMKIINSNGRVIKFPILIAGIIIYGIIYFYSRWYFNF